MRLLLTVTAILEAATGLALLVAPSLTIETLLGPPLDAPAAEAVARLAGVALLTIGVICRAARNDSESRVARGIVAGVLLYNCGAVAVLVRLAASGGAGLRDLRIWPLAILHATLAVWCGASLSRRPDSFLGSRKLGP